METGLFTLWSIAHFLGGVVLAFIFSRKWLKVIKYAGILFLFPLFFINNASMRIISLTIIIFAIFAIIIGYLSSKRKKLNKYQSVVIVLVLILGWEIFEYFTYSLIGLWAESLANRVADIVIGFAGFILTFILLHKIKKSQ